MIPAATFSSKRVALFGLGGSGRATLDSLLAGGARVWLGDDRADVVATIADRADGLLTTDTDFSTFDALVLAPGIPLTHPEPHWSARAAHAAGVPIIGDLEIFTRERAQVAPDAPLVCITGTNGKSTTTALIAHVLTQAGRDVAMGGNIGTPVLALPPADASRVHVIECSSYQIDLAASLRPTIGVHLNLSPDHLDRHGTFEAYAAIKERLIAASETAVIGMDDAASAAIAGRHEGPSVRISGLETRTDIGARWPDLFIDGEFAATLRNAPALRGSHNAQNAAAAIGVCRALGLSLEEIQRGLDTFPGLAHRMQIVRVIDGVTFVNDSKATNADATANALRAYAQVHWIVGGRAKAEGIDPLRPLFDRIAKAYLIGEAEERFSRTLKDVATTSCGTLDVAVRQAAEDAARGGEGERIVLLSPACASFDQFPSFVARGDRFIELVEGLDRVTP